MSLIQQIFENKPTNEKEVELTECNYTDDYYGDQVCLTRKVDISNFDL